MTSNRVLMNAVRELWETKSDIAQV